MSILRSMASLGTAAAEDAARICIRQVAMFHWRQHGGLRAKGGAYPALSTAFEGGRLMEGGMGFPVLPLTAVSLCIRTYACILTDNPPCSSLNARTMQTRSP